MPSTDKVKTMSTPAFEDLPAAHHYDGRSINWRGAPNAAYQQRVFEVIRKARGRIGAHFVMSGTLTKN